MSYLPLTRGPCPVCDRQIMNEQRTAYLPGGGEFTIRFTDGTYANFAICAACYETLTTEQVRRLVHRQIVNWGLEIMRQLEWFTTKAVHVEAERWARTRGELDG